ncbi:MAG TPA: zinc finger Ran-binding domain-containing protein [Pseudogracilibacillus sp.]|nr:zinc finger Ran-binding domain-containing protein [Pseudogracilibacillus sp.]
MGETVSTVFSILLLLLMFAIAIIWIMKEQKESKKMNKIYSVISISRVTSVLDISRTTGLAATETRELINKLIEKAKTNRDFRIMRNAYIDHQHDKVILDPKAVNNVFDRAVDSIVGGLFPKKEKRLDWTCSYCQTLNRARLYNCHNCGAGKPAPK